MFSHQALVSEMKNLRRFALKLTRNTDDAEDLLQSTVLRALEKKDLFQDKGRLFSWLSKIMYNIFVSDYRRRARFETQYDPETYIGAASVEASQETKIALAEAGEAMQKIPQDQRQMLYMVGVQGMRYAEVSKALAIPVGTVRSRLSRARESLQKNMDASPAMFPAGAGRQIASAAMH